MMSKVIKPEVCSWLICELTKELNNLMSIFFQVVHLVLVSRCKRANCSVKLSIDGLWRSDLFLLVLLCLEKTSEVFEMPFSLFLTPFGRIAAGQSQISPVHLVRHSTSCLFGLEICRGPLLCCTVILPGRTALLTSASWTGAKKEQTATMSCSSQLPSSVNCQPWFYV